MDNHVRIAELQQGIREGIEIEESNILFEFKENTENADNADNADCGMGGVPDEENSTFLPTVLHNCVNICSGSEFWGAPFPPLPNPPGIRVGKPIFSIMYACFLCIFMAHPPLYTPLYTS